jgi:hypothetical protein
MAVKCTSGELGISRQSYFFFETLLIPENRYTATYLDVAGKQFIGN